MGGKIKKPELSVLRQGKILITTKQYYGEIKLQLQGMGFIEIRDFDYCYNVHKKIVFINGNCHCDILKLYLRTSKKFSDTYAFGNWPLIFKKIEYDEAVLPYCDLFIHQDIRRDNIAGYKYSDEYILPKLKDDCISCRIPNLYGFPKALFVKNYKMIPEKSMGCLGNPFLYYEEIVGECINNKDSLKGIIERLKEQFIAEKDIVAQWEKDRMSLVQREKVCDVRISDFIDNNIRTAQLFYDVGHPTNILLREMANRILAFLKIDDTVTEISESLNCYEVPVYDCIKRALKLEWNSQYIRKEMRNTQRFVLRDVEMDLEEYIREYIWWYYEKDIG